MSDGEDNGAETKKQLTMAELKLKAAEGAMAARAMADMAVELKQAKATLRQQDDRLHYLEGGGLLGDDGEGATDGSHPNDLGMLRQARAVAAALQKALR